MKRIAKKLGKAAYWLGWPFWMVYFRFGERTRVLLVHGNKVLVVAGWLSDGRWGLPGGGLHKGEDPAVGVLRELKEEVGIAVPKSSLTLLGVEPYKNHGYRYVYYQFVAEVDGELPTHRQWHEISDARWTDYRELTPQNAKSDVLHAIRKWRATMPS
jgi:8-oxo-dGTP pyrophosphatase MutT (NUDIX family)